uniref:Reticulocalbin 2 n=1 Tax=Petromyzon marinus TaxID=7757 RepID=S4RPB0_PETMA
MQSFRRYATEETRAFFPEVDRDGDGVVSWDEYRQHEYESLPGGDGGEAAAAAAQVAHRMQLYAREKKKFGKADSDGVQGLNITEFLAFEHPEEFDYMQDSVLEEALLEHDKDGDGFVDLAEFLGDYHRDPSTPQSDPEWVITETDKFTSEFDIDHDGKLNPSELLSWLMPNNLEVAEDETEHLLEHMDTDGDGQLSHDEVVQNKELFLTSEVTDYGRQLGEQYAHHEEL